jgi:hypothetical protein
MTIAAVKPHQMEQFRDLALKEGSVFSDPLWAKIFGEKVTLYGIFGNDGNLVGGFMLAKESMFGLPYYSAPAHTPSIGLFYSNPSKNSSNRISREKDILGELSAFLRKMNFAILRLCLPAEVKDMQPFIWDKFKVVPHYTYHIDLRLDENELRSRLSDKLRNHMKKSASTGISSREVSDYSLLLPVIEETFIRQKLNVSKDRIRKILLEFSNPSNSFACGTYEGDTLLAMAFCVHDRSTAYYLFGGVTKTQEHSGSGAVSLWEAIRLARNRGLKTFDLEGSMIPNVEKFFRAFGGELTPYYTLNRAPLPVEIALKFFKRELF